MVVPHDGAAEGGDEYAGGGDEHAIDGSEGDVCADVTGFGGVIYVENGIGGNREVPDVISGGVGATKR